MTVSATRVFLLQQENQAVVKKQARLTAAKRKSQVAGLADGKKACAGKQSSMVLLKSGLSPDSLEELKAFGKEPGVRVVDKWTPSVTHVVCGMYGDLPLKCAFYSSNLSLQLTCTAQIWDQFSCVAEDLSWLRSFKSCMSACLLLQACRFMYACAH